MDKQKNIPTIPLPLEKIEKGPLVLNASDNLGGWIILPSVLSDLYYV